MGLNLFFADIAKLDGHHILPPVVSSKVMILILPPYNPDLKNPNIDSTLRAAGHWSKGV